MVYRDAKYINKLLLFYISKFLIIAETDDVMADTIFLKTDNFSFVFEFGIIFLSNQFVCARKEYV